MAKQTRKLTAAEEARKASFEVLSEEMIAKGFHRHDLTLDIAEIGSKAILMMSPAVVLLVISFFLWNPIEAIHLTTGVSAVSWFLLWMMLLIFLHEAIHALTWAIFTKEHLKSVHFGVMWQYLTPYCTCDEPLGKWQYIIGGAMPTIILGFGLGGYAIKTGSLGTLALAVIMVISGGGDALIIKNILGYPVQSGSVYYDHPYEAGVVVFEKEKNT